MRQLTRMSTELVLSPMTEDEFFESFPDYHPELEENKGGTCSCCAEMDDDYIDIRAGNHVFQLEDGKTKVIAE